MRKIVLGRANGNTRVLLDSGTVPSPPMPVIPARFWPLLVFLDSASDLRAATMSSSTARVRTKSIRPPKGEECCLTKEVNRQELGIGSGLRGSSCILQSRRRKYVQRTKENCIQRKLC